MRWQDFIDPTETLHGSPVFKGTRIRVEDILERLTEGWTETRLLEAHPELKRDHILAALAYDARKHHRPGEASR